MMLTNSDDAAMKGFREIEEVAEPWAQKTAKKAEKTVEEVVTNAEKAVEETVAKAEAEGISEPVEGKAEAEPVDDYAYDDAEAVPDDYAYDDYLDPNDEYTFDDAEDPVPASALPTAEAAPEGEDAEREELVEGLCRWGAARAGVVVVVPAWGAPALLVNEVYMILRIGREYGVELTVGGATAVLTSLGATFIGQTLATLVPFPPLQIPIAISVTYGAGKAVAAWMKAGRPSNMEEFRDIFQKERNRGAANVAEFQNLDCKDIPLGDEAKKLPLTDRAFDTVADGLDFTGDKLTALFGSFADAVGDKLKEIKEEKQAEYEARVAYEKTLPPEEKGFIANVRDGYEGTKTDIQNTVNDLFTAAGAEMMDAITENLSNSSIAKFFTKLTEEYEAECNPLDKAATVEAPATDVPEATGQPAETQAEAAVTEQESAPAEANLEPTAEAEAKASDSEGEACRLTKQEEK